MKYIRRIKWKNILVIAVMIFCAYIVLHDMFMLTIASWLTGRSYGWTLLGFISFMMAASVLGVTYDYFEDVILKSIK